MLFCKFARYFQSTFWQERLWKAASGCPNVITLAFTEGTEKLPKSCDHSKIKFLDEIYPQFIVLNLRKNVIWNLALGTWHMAPTTWHLAPGTWNLTPGPWHLTPGTWHQRFEISELNNMTLHKKWSFLLEISSVNTTKSAWNDGFGHIY